ncbi:invasion associated locus B family protein [Bartonella sp. A05]|uniref:invasion associated locus B family protein n=1 Tax=Bartonella sp. A05 TaxID=2967261 RepID=UPI0022A9E767|nr:invasion associated locus B family protein [Bartonella sp. A05]MCZ2203953.1 invasion associated locus B family protein [Bartonella sp. A05]
MKKIVNFFVIFAFLSISSTAFAQNAKPNAASLPNGASSLTETYGLWRVHCGLQEGKKVCSMSRQEVNDQNRIVVAAEIKLNSDGSVSGDLLVPFGILVSKPVHLQVDDGKAVIETAIRTCYPGGCLVPIAFDKNFIAALRAGKHLKLAMTVAVSGEPALNDLFVQLNGFSNALNRLAALQK